ncbi:hypothetical protein G6F31_021692 [Rhizopus arrhizus]|nr:hypothetical protein G6F31_021692 [Rhizopus arrhizus]
MDTPTIKALARRLDEAEQTRTQVRALSLDHPDITIADAYAIQRDWVAQKIAAGRRLVDRRTRLRRVAGRHAVRRRRRDPPRPLHRAARRG